jgi:hypothetical protein
MASLRARMPARHSSLASSKMTSQVGGCRGHMTVCQRWAGLVPCVQDQPLVCCDAVGWWCSAGADARHPGDAEDLSAVQLSGTVNKQA